MAGVVREPRPEGRIVELVNLPTRAMKGASWTGEERDWKAAPHQYAAIHFHEDDLYDCGWETSFAWRIPGDLPIGIYAARLRSGTAGEDHIPFFVLPPKGEAKAPVAFLAASGPSSLTRRFARPKKKPG